MASFANAPPAPRTSNAAAIADKLSIKITRRNMVSSPSQLERPPKPLPLYTQRPACQCCYYIKCTGHLFYSKDRIAGGNEFRMNAQVYSPNCVELDFSHLEGKGIDMLLIPIAQQAL